MTRSMYDAAYAPPDPHLDVCAFYIGFSGNTPHVWSDAEVGAQSARWRLPIVTRVNAQGSSQADADADTAVSWMQAHGVPRGCAVALDFEAQVNGAYITAFDKRVVSRGYTVLLYGQESTVYQNPRPSAGYWSGQWTQTPHLDSRDSATQWASDQQLGKPYDLSQVSDSLVLWDTRPIAPDPAPLSQEEEMILLNGFNGPAVAGLSGGLLWPVQDAQSVQAYQAAGVKVATVTPAEYNAIVAAIEANRANLTITDAQVSGSITLNLT